MTLDDYARLLVIAAIVNLGLTSMLVYAAVRHEWTALRERAAVAVILAVVAVGAAVLGLVRLQVIALPNGYALALLAIGLLLVSLPSVIWFAVLVTGGFDEPDSSGESGRP